MGRRCIISGVTHQSGHKVSHAKNKTKRLFKANLQNKRLYLTSEKRWVKVKVSTRILRTIDKLGLEATLRSYNLTVADIS